MADQRDQTLFAKSVPQQTVPIEPTQPVGDLISKLSKRNQEQAKALAEGRDEAQEPKHRNLIGQKLLMEVLKGGNS